MGLAGQKKRQRISQDPQNRHWKDGNSLISFPDTSTFGFKMLQRMGWSEGKGLGLKEDGLTEHLKIKFKEDTLGIGADRRTIDNWMENTSAFDALLQNLNASNGDAGQEETSKEAKREAKRLKKEAKKQKALERETIEPKKPAPTIQGRL